MTVHDGRLTGAWLALSRAAS